MKKRFIPIVLVLLMLVSFAACTQNAADTPDNGEDIVSAPPSGDTPGGGEADGAESPGNSPQQDIALVTADREGNPVTLPAGIERVISMGPSNTEMLVALGHGDKIIAADEYSADVEGIPADVSYFSMMTPDGEQIINLEPDVVFVTGMSKAAGDDPFKVISDAGICVLYIPSSESIAEIKEDIRFVAAVMGAQVRGEEIVSEMEREIEEISQIAQTIAQPRTVYFEISAAPYMYSFGTGVFLNELIEIIGAKNIMDDQSSWISLADETVIDRNPDVILTSVYYIDDPVGEILSRPGWDALTAVQNGDVYQIDANASNRPSQHIVKALHEMALAVYPDVYGS